MTGGVGCDDQRKMLTAGRLENFFGPVKIKPGVKRNIQPEKKICCQEEGKVGWHREAQMNHEKCNTESGRPQKLHMNELCCHFSWSKV